MAVFAYNKEQLENNKERSPMQTKPDRITSTIPFVGLHAHSGMSPFDGLGMPKEHMEFAHENGMRALAMTDHGHMNGLSYQVEHLKKMRKGGKEFKAIYGCETYFIPSHKKWRVMRDEHQANSKKQKKEEFKMVVEEEDKGRRKFNPLNNRSHLVIVAQNQVGLNNLFQLVSDSYRPENFYRYPRMDFEMLEEYNEGLIVSSACLSGVLANDMWRNKDKSPDHVLEAMRATATRFKDIFGDRFYGEVQWNDVPEQHELNNYVIQVCIELGIQVISTADSHYPRPELWKDREMYKRIGWAGKAPAWGEDANLLPESVEDIGYELYPKNGDQMWESYKKYSSRSKVEYDDDFVLASITRTHDIAYDRIEDFLPDATVRLPEFVIPEGKTATQALTELAISGLKEKELHTDKEYVERLKYEIDIIDTRGFSQYFLTMKAINDKAQDMMLVGLGRGSAGGSLLAYVLNITQIDPIKYNLQFERFLTKGGSGYPDIDSDYESRMDLVRALQDDWGETTVVPISNFNTLQLRSLLKDLGKFYDVPFMEVNKVTGAMMGEATPKAKKAHGITAGVYVPTFSEVKEYSESLQAFFEKHPQIATHVDVLFGNIRSTSRHAGGVLVTENLDRHMPLINSGGTIQAPWAEGQNVRHLEPLGFIKFDLLGLSTLRMISGAIRHILKRHHNIPDPSFGQVRDFYNKNLHPDVLDFNDEEVWKSIFHRGKWAGIFQMTNGGAQKFCQEARPTSLEDFAAITAIYRPGPLSANVHKLYVANKENPKQVTYDHPIIKEVLGDTYGLLVFQEQLAMLAHKIGEGLTLDEGNMLRKVLTKKGTGKTQEVKEALRGKFDKGGLAKGFKQAQLDDLWQKMIYFSGYSFNQCLSFSELVTVYSSGGEVIADLPICEVSEGDLVRSRDENTGADLLVPVLKNHNNGTKKVFRFTLDDGRSIECTMDHKFRTECGRMLPIQRVLEENLDIVVSAEKKQRQQVV